MQRLLFSKPSCTPHLFVVSSRFQSLKPACLVCACHKLKGEAGLHKAMCVRPNITVHVPCRVGCIVCDGDTLGMQLRDRTAIPSGH